MATTFIYGLKDPNTEEIRYIGKSNNPEFRLTQHMTERHGNQRKIAWLRSLKKDGQKPILEILQEVAADKWQEAEIAWIERGREDGWDLTNIHPGGEYVGDASMARIDYDFLNDYFTASQIEMFFKLPSERRLEIIRAMALSIMPHATVFQKACAYLGISILSLPREAHCHPAVCAIGALMLEGDERTRRECLQKLEKSASRVVSISQNYVRHNYGAIVGVAK